MTDGYLAAGKLTLHQARVLFGFGAFTQLMDDLEDIRPDMLEKTRKLVFRYSSLLETRRFDQPLLSFWAQCSQ